MPRTKFIWKLILPNPPFWFWLKRIITSGNPTWMENPYRSCAQIMDSRPLKFRRAATKFDSPTRTEIFISAQSFRSARCSPACCFCSSNHFPNTFGCLERSCVADQPQRFARNGRRNKSDLSWRFDVLRLVEDDTAALRALMYLPVLKGNWYQTSERGRSRPRFRVNPQPYPPTFRSETRGRERSYCCPPTFVNALTTLMFAALAASITLMT